MAAPNLSKAARIRKLYAEGNPCKEIAHIVGCSPEYVRVCARQRTGDRYMSRADLNWRIGKFGSLKAYQDAHNDRYRSSRLGYYADKWRNDPEYRKRSREWNRAYRARKRLKAEARP